MPVYQEFEITYKGIKVQTVVDALTEVANLPPTYQIMQKSVPGLQHLNIICGYPDDDRTDFIFRVLNQTSAAIHWEPSDTYSIKIDKGFVDPNNRTEPLDVQLLSYLEETRPWWQKLGNKLGSLSPVDVSRIIEERTWWPRI